MSALDWALLAAVTLMAAIAQAATGFGFGLIVTPFLLIILDSSAAIQVTIACTTVISAVVIPRIWRAVQIRLLLRLIGGSIVGFPIGMLAFMRADLATLKLAVGVMILIFTACVIVSTRQLSASSPGPEIATRPRNDLIAGMASGALTAALGMPGPPILIYLLHMRMPAEVLRATTLSLFAFSYLVSLLAHASLVGITPAVWTMAGVLAPIAVVGGFIGHATAHRLSTRAFRVAVLSILGGAGVYMVYAGVSS